MLSDKDVVLLFITERCNLTCDYCYVRQGTNVMPFEVAKKVIDQVSEGTIIDLFGGEPTLELDLLHRIVDYARSTGKRLPFQLYTNGSHYSDSLVALIRKGVNISISFDGLASEARTHSQEVTETIIGNIKLLKGLLS